MRFCLTLQQLAWFCLSAQRQSKCIVLAIAGRLFSVNLHELHCALDFSAILTTT